MLSSALSYLTAGLSVIPVGHDKRPVISWQDYQNRLATENDLARWFASGSNQIGMICGKVSGGLIAIDFDCKYDLRGDLMARWKEIVNDAALIKRLCIQSTPSGGFHAVFQSDVEIRNTKLAQRYTTEEERDNEHDKIRVLIETRGEGGYIVAAPSQGYQVKYGGFDQLQVLTAEETHHLLDAAKALNEVATEQTPRGQSDITPLDDYDAKATEADTLGLLQSAGWMIASERGGTVYLRRPGKDRGISATWNAIPGKFYPFSTSSAFEAQRSYSPAAVYAVLQHNGDFSAAAKTLRTAGYGSTGNHQPVEAIVAQEPVKKLLKVIRAKDVHTRVRKLWQHGVQKGVSTGWAEMDDNYTIWKGSLNIITGIPSHGKSEFVDAIMVNLSIAHGWKWMIFSPENWPLELHIQKLAEKYINKPMHGQGAMQEHEVDEGLTWVHDHFFFVDGITDGVTVEALTDHLDMVCNDLKIDGWVCDPWNELEHTRRRDENESEFIGRALMLFRKCSRRNKVAGFIVAHPFKMPKDPKNNTYPVPTLYDISGSANWYNKADNGIAVYRNIETGNVEIHIQKIKFKYFGRPGKVELKYMQDSGRYRALTQAEKMYGKEADAKQQEFHIGEHMQSEWEG